MNSQLLTEFARVINSDRYQYTESSVFLGEKMENKNAVFDVFFRKTEDGGFAVVSGILEIVDLIRILNETSEDEKRHYFDKIISDKNLLEFLVKLKFTGNLSAMREGEIAYPNEPIIRITAPLIEAKILETPILNIINHQMAIATKASRVTRAAHPIGVSSFGSRRAHGFDSAVYGNKAAYIGGCESHSNLVTEYLFDITSIGTMAHSYVQSFGNGKLAEFHAFKVFLKHRKPLGQHLILLIDTFDTLKIGIKNAINAFQDEGIDNNYRGNYGVRIDSGDLATLSITCRNELDRAGLTKAKIILTSSLDENLIRSIKQQGAKVDLFGVGDSIAVSKSNPCFGGVYKLSQIDNSPVIKLSGDIFKVTNPGAKCIYRIYQNEKAVADIIALQESDKELVNLKNSEKIALKTAHSNITHKINLEKNSYSLKPLLIDFVHNGNIRNLSLLSDIKKSQSYYFEVLDTLEESYKRLEFPQTYPILISNSLQILKKKLIVEIEKGM
ncbi:MAG: nicotinate phosphoribosyltransferase [Fusobacteria bacterium]|nr:nicotinate phosphoribosyltransferase [Fusobacteriota bacterium]